MTSEGGSRVRRRRFLPLLATVPLLAVLGVWAAAQPNATHEPVPGPTAVPSQTTAMPAPRPSPSARPVGPPLPASAFIAPRIAWPLPDLDPTLASRVGHPSLAALSSYLYGNAALFSFSRLAPILDWRLSRPNMAAVSGYADAVSVIPGATIGLHLAGRDGQARIDVFRLGARDATHLLTVPSAPVAAMRVPSPEPATGLDEMSWPTSYRLHIPPTWASGVYLAKLTATDGQSYVPFIVRPTTPTALCVVIPIATFEAYNQWNGASLYHWSPLVPRRPSRAYAVSFDRPFATENGAGLLLRTTFPLIVWLEDHGYRPGYIADTDLETQPACATSARTIVIAGHAEYWSAGMRATLAAAEGRGIGVAAFGANLIYWQVRLAPDRAGHPSRTMVCYKDSTLDPVAVSQPELATVQFSRLRVPEPAGQLLGADYAGITLQTLPLIVAPTIARFAPWIGLRAGARLPALLGGELDTLSDPSRGVAITATPVVDSAGQRISATGSLWVSAGGAHVFDAGTFAWTWGLDPRYASALPGFPTDRFAYLTAEILAWCGTMPGA